MKKICFIFFVFVCILCSCTDDSVVSNANKDVYLDLETTLSETDYKNVSENMLTIVNTRATLNDEECCRKALKPLVEDGKRIKEQILEQLDGNYENDSLKFLKDLTEEELASLSFMVYNINSIENMDNQATRALSSARIRSCLGAAIGISAIRELGVGGVIRATTLRRALFAIGKRYLGYIGVVLMVADFYDCYNG